MVKVIGMSEKIDDQEFIEYFTKQNSIDKEDITFVRLYEMKTRKPGRFNAILEVNEEKIVELLKRGTVKIVFDMCKIVKHFSIMRCYKCLGFYHTAVNCKNKKACSLCAGEHNGDECESQVIKCVNCVSACEKMNLELDVKHHAFSHECHVLNQMLKKEKNRISVAE